MNKKQTVLAMHAAVAQNYGLKFVEAKLTDKPWISIFSKPAEQEISPVAMYQIKEGYANMFGFDVDDLRIKIFSTRVVIFDLNKVDRVKEGPAGVTWYYKSEAIRG